MSFTQLLTLENQIFKERVQICLFRCIVCLIVTRIVDLFLWEYFESGMINLIRNQNYQNLLHKLAFKIIHLFHFEIIFQRQKSRMQRIDALISRMASFAYPFMPLRFKGMIFLVWMVILHLHDLKPTILEKTFVAISVYALQDQPLVAFFPPHADHGLVSTLVIKTLALQHKSENNIWPAYGHPELSHPSRLSGILSGMTWLLYL